jgi:predicted TIM-barrel fold metal-dependent hydrolase
MKASPRRFAIALITGAAGLIILLSWPKSPTSFAVDLPSSNPVLSRDLKDFAALNPIDTHTHVFNTNPAFVEMLRQLHLQIVDICVVNDHSSRFKSPEPELENTLSADLKRQLDTVWSVVRSARGHVWLCTTFDPYRVNDPGFSGRAIQQLDKNFADGAVAVKIWKNIGMEIKRPDGKFVMPDDPAFEGIYKDIAAHNKTLIAHLAEPDTCWQPPNPNDPVYDYYKEHQEWYMYRLPDHPSKATILAARDRMLAENPGLRVVGAHLGSMETDVDEIGRHFDRYPNFAVDTAARVANLRLQPPAKVRSFPIKYQDRVLHGTDLEFLPAENTQAAIKEWDENYTRDWKYFADSEAIDYAGHKIQGLKLPQPVLRKLLHDNAVRWIPGI